MDDCSLTQVAFPLLQLCPVAVSAMVVANMFVLMATTATTTAAVVVVTR